MRAGVNFSLFFLAALGVASAAAAEETKADAKDPNRLICEKQKELGSRIATKKICLTAAQWEERKREDREAIDKGQRQARGPNGG